MINKKTFYAKVIILAILLIVSIIEIILQTINLAEAINLNISYTSYLVGIILFSIIASASMVLLIIIIIAHYKKIKYYTLKK